MTQEQAERARVCEVAQEYIRTPYHNEGMIKGVGVDCATFPIMVYSDAGIIDRFVPGHYDPQWFLHQGEELYLNDLLRYAREVDAPGRGDMVLFRIGRLFAHGAIVLDWPLIIHASKPDHMVCMAEADKGALSDRKKHPVRFFSHWG